MSSFVKHFSDMSCKNAFRNAFSSCDAVNTTADNFNIANFADTVIAVSVLLSLLIAILLNLLGLFDLIVIANFITINLMSLLGVKGIKAKR